MHLITAKEVDKLKEHGVKVIIDDRAAHDSTSSKIPLGDNDEKVLFIRRNVHELYGEFSNSVVATCTGIEFFAFIGRTCLGRQSVRTGSFSHYKDRFMANFFRKRALRRIKRVLL